MQRSSAIAVGAVIAIALTSATFAQDTPHSDDAIRAELLGVLVYTDVTVELDDTPARDALEHLRLVLGIPIVGRYDDDRVGFGIDPETPVTVRASGQPALVVLEMILDQCAGQADDQACTWQLGLGFVEVGTKERLNMRSDVRTYLLRDLLMEHPYFDNAPALDLDAALNQGPSGGSAGFGGGAGGGTGDSRGNRGSGGGSGGTGGGIFGPPEGDAPRTRDDVVAQDVIDLVVDSIEPDLWGHEARIMYKRGALVVRAPDYVHRKVAGYRFVTRPKPPAQQRRFLEFGAGRTRIGERP